MIKRAITAELIEASREYPVITVLGPRQSGKTTLVQMTFPDKPYYSLESPDVRIAASEDPRGFLSEIPQGAILDEIQRLPTLLSYIQGIVDQKNIKGQFILTGSHQPELHQSISQTLAGRTAVLTLLPFALTELHQYRKDWSPFELIAKGGYPRLHEEGLKETRFFNSYLQTYVERDVRALINIKDLRTFQQFLMLLAGRVGQIVNYSSLSNDVGVSSTTIKNWLSVLKASFLVFELPPFFQNIRKRVIKSPKIYFIDTGLAAHLLNINSPEQVMRDPLRGGFYENLVILEILKQNLNQGIRPDMYFYRDTHDNEVDLILRRNGKLIPIEIKSAATFTPEFLKGIQHFRKVIGERPSGGCVLYNGKETYKLKGIQIVNPITHGRIDAFLPK
jgi:predicted AAA+ superfamily ATPase